MKSVKLVSLICMLTMVASILCSCMIENTNPAVRVGEEEMSADEFGYYVYVNKSQALQEAGVDVSDDKAVEDYFKAKTDGKSNIDAVLDKASEDATSLLVQYNKAISDGTEFTEEDEAEFKNQIDSMKAQTGGEEGYVSQLSSLGITPEAFEGLFKKNMIISKYIHKLETEGKFNVSDEEISTYIKENYIKAQHILFMTQDPATGELYEEDTVSEKRAKAEETLDKLNNGEDFVKLMNELSEDTGLSTNPDGYEFTKGQMVPQFEKAAYALEENQISDIVETSYGYHIIKRVPFEITEEKIAELKDQAMVACQTEKLDASVQEWEKEYEVKVFKSVIRKFK